MKYFYLLILIACFVNTVIAQPVQKKIIAKKTNIAPKIDGILDDTVWRSAPVATDFVELNPVAGRHEKAEQRTEVRILYDNTAIYLAARMYETDKSKVAHELTTRDNIGNSDFIGIVLDTYLDGLNASGFYVTAAGVQFDAKYAPNSNGNNEDPNWNAVWQSKVIIDDQGWTAEFKIPYSALRFPKKDVQTWGMNFVRKRQFEQKQLFWNELDPKKNGFINQEGQLTDIAKLEPPVRLAFYPYFSTYVNNYPYNTSGIKNTTGSVNGGMDVKYGINQSFTLDLTLIPDFGQVQSDNQVLNLTPFRVKYNENRPFFTEGTELFNKGNLFYSRNIGGTPIDYSNITLSPHEAIIQNPSESRLLNATKLSGRMANGLGIGIFNAVTQSEQAIVQDSVTGNRRNIQTAPTTNYNILVLDQNLKNNSSFTLINTNVDRFGYDYNANVGGFVYNLNNKKNSYNLSGFGFRSDLTKTGGYDLSGYAYEVNFGKTLGTFTWAVTQDLVTDNYNPNDLGFLNNPNYLDHNISTNYAIYKPNKYFNQWNIWTNIYYSRRFDPSVYQTMDLAIGGNVTLKNNWQLGGNGHIAPGGHDFYVPEVTGLYYNTPSSYRLNFYGNTNRAKRLSGGFFVQIVEVNNGQESYANTDELFYTLRISDKFSFGQDVTYIPQRNFYGYLTVDGNDESIFSLYNRNTIENIFNLKYTFTNKMGLALRLRHYWSKRNNSSFYQLQKDGSLARLAGFDYSSANDEDFNTLNTDMIYTWEFSPGSQLSIAYKNSSLTDDNQAGQGYFNNVHKTFNSPINNNFSLKILYYIDYQNIRKHRKA